MIIFTIPIATPTNNYLKGMNRFVYKSLREKIAWMVASEVGMNCGEPVEICDIIITRYGSRLLDWDNCYGGIKPLMDCLVTSTGKNPNGLGIILDDNPQVVITLTMHQEKCKRSEERTTVKILQRD